jgi:hypothetical protein
MRDSRFSAYLNRLGRMLPLDSAHRDDIRRELQAHYEDALADKLADGMSAEQVTDWILDDLGDAADLAQRFGAVDRKRRWIMRMTSAAACQGLLALVLNSFPPAERPTLAVAEPARAGSAAKPEQDTSDAVDAAIAAALRQTIAEVRLRDVPLEDALEWLGEFMGVNLHVYWADLEQYGVLRDDLITIDVKNLPVERVLRLALDSASPDVAVGYAIDEGVLVVATEARLEQNIETVVYDVRDLLEFAVRDWANSRAYMYDWVRSSTSSILTEDRADAVAQRLMLQFDKGMLYVGPATQRLQSVVMAGVAPESWHGHGGPGTCEIFNGMLIVRQTPQVHAEIEALLQDLREVGLQAEVSAMLSPHTAED